MQNRYSIGERQGEPIVVYCAHEGIAFVPYDPLGADPMKHGAPLASAEGGLADIGKHLGATSTQMANDLQKKQGVFTRSGTFAR